MAHDDNPENILNPQSNWSEMWFYQKTVVLYHLTCNFTSRFLPSHGDRTVDQMIQAARSGKQNIVEGMTDGVTSTETEIKLLNVARGSIQELKEDYEDFLIRNKLSLWNNQHPKYNAMLDYCRGHNLLEDYSPYFMRWSPEVMANVAITLSHMVDKMMLSHLKKLEEKFVKNGGIREKMMKARLDYRNKQNKLKN